MKNLSRRSILKASALAAAPMVLPSSVFGQNAPSTRIAIGCIGVGRMGMGDLMDVIGVRGTQIVAVCDVDKRRVEGAKKKVDTYYSTTGCKTFHDFRELCARPDIDAVQICTPEQWHAYQIIAAARAGKDIFVQKPLSYTLEEGRKASDVVRQFGRILQVGSQQRSDRNFRFACELARNGRIGQIKTVKSGLPMDEAGGKSAPMPVPANLDYEFWLGPAPWAPYTEDRVHPQDINGRPGWLRIEDYCLGMITGWGSHHNDIAQWGMNTEATGPVEVQATAEYLKGGLWDVHVDHSIEYTYASGVKLICADSKKVKPGVTFEGTEGWVWVTRGAIDAEPKSLLTASIGASETRLPESRSHKQNWIDAVRNRTQPIAPVETGHRSCSVCILGHIAMKLGTKLKWDPAAERFTNSDEANRMLSRAPRGEWTL